MPTAGPEDRVALARLEKESVVRSLCAGAHLPYPPKRVFFRAFKREKILELWGANSATETMRLIKSYPVAAASGGAGPKRIEGDQQVPEGFYSINRFNPQSRFWLSLGLNYPNASDRILSDPAKPGGDIFIHGNCVSIGCLAMTDDAIKEIYLLALGAHSSGKNVDIPVHIFPCRMTTEALRELVAKHPDNPAEIHLWASLKKGFDAFEKTHRVPSVSVRPDGSYAIRTRT